MRFFVRKRRQTPTVIIVALIDVLIVLLIFLMVTTTFKQQPAVRIVLPESSRSQITGASETAPVLVSIDTNGLKRLGVDALPVTDERLENELKAGVAKNPDLKVAISADTGAPWGEVLKVMNLAAGAGIKHPVNAFVKPKGP